MAISADIPDTVETDEKETVPAPAIENGDVKVQPAEDLEKTYYSKLSVWLMVLFSGLAIGSDG